MHHVSVLNTVLLKHCLESNNLSKRKMWRPNKPGDCDQKAVRAICACMHVCVCVELDKGDWHLISLWTVEHFPHLTTSLMWRLVLECFTAALWVVSISHMHLGTPGLPYIHTHCWSPPRKRWPTAAPDPPRELACSSVQTKQVLFHQLVISIQTLHTFISISVECI